MWNLVVMGIAGDSPQGRIYFVQKESNGKIIDFRNFIIFLSCGI